MRKKYEKIKMVSMSVFKIKQMCQLPSEAVQFITFCCVTYAFYLFFVCSGAEAEASGPEQRVI